jgi:hypothetical protein
MFIISNFLFHSYKKRKQAVQHAIQNKISADRLKNINNKCVSSKNNSKGFWEMLREYKSDCNSFNICSIEGLFTYIENIFCVGTLLFLILSKNVLTFVWCLWLTKLSLPMSFGIPN